MTDNRSKLTEACRLTSAVGGVLSLALETNKLSRKKIGDLTGLLRQVIGLLEEL